jgi:tripartite-type tricarboxylate transporter receptor subunit TctC
MPLIGRKFMKKILASFAIAASVAATAFSAQAQDYPDRTITMVVPFAAGGPTDTVARLVAESMSKDLGQQIVVENVGGAGGTLGAGRVAGSEADGYTMLLHHIGMATSATLYRKLAYDTLNAFEYVGLVTEVPMTIVARKDLEPTDLKSLVEYAKTNKDTVTVANAGVGAASHLCGMLFMTAIGTPLVTVPYKGTGPAMTDLLGGQVDIMCDQTTNTTKQILGGTIKAYAVVCLACRSASGTASTRPRAPLRRSMSACRSRSRSRWPTPMSSRALLNLALSRHLPRRLLRQRSRPSWKARLLAGSRLSKVPANSPTDRAWGAHWRPTPFYQVIAHCPARAHAMGGSHEFLFF